MAEENYNYPAWEGDGDLFEVFAINTPKATMRAPSFFLEDLETGDQVELKELWKRGVTVIEFGSFT